MSMGPVLFSSLLLAFASPASAASQPRNAGIIEHIIDGTSVNVQRGESPLSLHRGEELMEGDTVTTAGETVYIQLLRHNELQLTPHSEMTIDQMGIGKTDEDTDASQVTLKKGILWGLLANGMSMATPFVIRTDEIAAAVAGANIIVERAESSKTTTLLSLEGTVKYGKEISELRLTRTPRFMNAGFRLTSSGETINAPKRFKRHLLISYLGKKAKATSKDISNRGFRALSSIIRKDAADTAEEQITWNVPAGVGATANSGGSGGGGANPNMPMGPGMSPAH